MTEIKPSLIRKNGNSFESFGSTVAISSDGRKIFDGGQ